MASLSNVEDQPRPLQLLNLPLDVLEAIIHEVAYTNDLCTLALTHSTLHSLVTPHIYSRFDIIWPDHNESQLEPHFGVDALTHGLGTLVMAREVFGGASRNEHGDRRERSCGHDHQNQSCRHSSTCYKPSRIRRGNHFAQYTKTFSLGNGPTDMVREYAIIEEKGKMLGTLVALAVGRMRNLESFHLDMPSGVLRDTFLALASLAERDDGQACRLEKVWVRWHDNSANESLNTGQEPQEEYPVPLYMHNIKHQLQSSTSNYIPLKFGIPRYPRVEFPTFSVLPPLKSLSVLDIDEPSYAEEMADLIAKSLHTLQELRVGVALKITAQAWIKPKEDISRINLLAAATVSKNRDKIPRMGGILGVLVSRFCDRFNPAMALNVAKPKLEGDPQDLHEGFEDLTLKEEHNVSDHLPPTSVNEYETDDQGGRANSNSTPSKETTDLTDNYFCPKAPTEPDDFGQKSHKLHLQTLELERIPLSIPVLSRALDWSCLKSLTLLRCENQQILWKALRKRFGPTARKLSLSLKQPARMDAPHLASADYPLQNLVHLHTDSVSPAFLDFVYVVLEPDTLQTLYLQQLSSSKSTVTIDQIHRILIRRHRHSLRKVLIDSSFRPDVPVESHRDEERSHAPRPNASQWLASRELITTITSPKTRLRELSFALDYKDWHFFLQQFSRASTIRSLHVSYIHEHPQATTQVYNRSGSDRREQNLKQLTKEMAMQVLDMVALRPQLELCYLALLTKCFEVVEYDIDNKKRKKNRDGKANSSGSIGIETAAQVQAAGPSSNNPFLTTNDEDDDHDDNESDHDDTSNEHSIPEAEDENDINAANDEDEFSFPHHEDDDEDDMEDESSDSTSTADDRAEKREKKKVGFKLREILFYDDKVGIFKARHGRL